jgi:hypothetical protein
LFSLFSSVTFDDENTRNDSEVDLSFGFELDTVINDNYEGITSDLEDFCAEMQGLFLESPSRTGII